MPTLVDDLVSGDFVEMPAYPSKGNTWSRRYGVVVDIHPINSSNDQVTVCTVTRKFHVERIEVGHHPQQHATARGYFQIPPHVLPYQQANCFINLYSEMTLGRWTSTPGNPSQNWIAPMLSGSGDVHKLLPADALSLKKIFCDLYCPCPLKTKVPQPPLQTATVPAPSGRRGKLNLSQLHTIMGQMGFPGSSSLQQPGSQSTPRGTRGTGGTQCALSYDDEGYDSPDSEDRAQIVEPTPGADWTASGDSSGYDSPDEYDRMQIQAAITMSQAIQAAITVSHDEEMMDIPPQVIEVLLQAMVHRSHDEMMNIRPKDVQALFFQAMTHGQEMIDIPAEESQALLQAMAALIYSHEALLEDETCTNQGDAARYECDQVQVREAVDNLVQAFKQPVGETTRLLTAI